ncbi:hypothetical protein V6N13_062654 [Hibiscus sabdariffa]|uniref:PWWP domain-containing protein n=1 Tax=Hibiscus sabdariffa TaxID=183260 RepID=A0ABR2BB16_9ROSI
MENPKTPETLETKNPDLELLEEYSDLLTLNESSNGLDSTLDALVQENGNAVGLDSLAMDVKENCVRLVDIVEGCLVDDGVDEKKEDHIGVVVPRPDERLEVRVDSGSEDNVVAENCKNEGSKEDHCSGINGVDSVRTQGDHIGVVVARSDERLEVRVDSGSEDNAVVQHAKNKGSKEEHCLGINGVDSVKRIQVSGDNISLYVDFSSFLCRLNNGVDEKKEDHISVDNAVVITFKDEGAKEDDCSGINRIDLVKRIQVSGDDISLYVDFTGTLTEVISSELMVSKEELQEPRNEEFVIDGQEHKFHVGDIVWITIKSQSWWPGKIVDNSEEPEYAFVGDDKNCLLVGYFGSSNVAWCHPSQLKPFHLNFDQMIGQNKDRSFLGAVEKAMDDFGKHLKLELACPCVLKENKFLSSNSATNEGASMAECKSSPLGVFSAVRFETEKFLYQIKNLARVVSKPGMLEFIVLQNYLSAFYRSMGHCQLPMHQLWGPTYDADSAGCSSIGGKDANAGLDEENSFSCAFLPEQSDVRKNEMSHLNQNGVLAKISDVNEGAFPENCRDVIAGTSVGSGKRASTSRKRKRKFYFEVTNKSTQFEGLDRGMCVSSVENGTELRNEMGLELRERKKSKYLSYPYVNWDNKGVNETKDPITLKFIRGSYVTDYPELNYTSSSELLSKLHFVAIDRRFATESKNFGLIEWFFSRFRISAYHDESIYEIQCNNMANQKVATATDLSLPATEMKPTSSPLTMNKMRKKKKLPNSGTFNTKSLSGMSDVNMKFADQQTTEASNLPDLNRKGAISIPLAEDLQVRHSEPRKRRKRAPSDNLKTNITPSLFVVNGINNANSSSFLLDFQVRDPDSVKTIAEQSNRDDLPDSGGIFVPLTRPNMVSFASESKPGQKKRGRKPKVTSGHPNPTLTVNILDPNVTSMEPNTLIKGLQEANSVSPEVKPVRKRRRKRGEASLSMRNIIVNYNQARTSGKPLATTLHLTFTPGSSLPSKEALVATFSRFGPLKESELQIFKDSSSARVIFMQSEDASKALRSLEESIPFGATLTKYNLQNDTILTTQRMEGFRLPASLTGPVPHLGDAPPIEFMRKNLEMMTQTLEKSGNNLSPEMKAKLESEIKELLKKVRSCLGSSSS